MMIALLRGNIEFHLLRGNEQQQIIDRSYCSTSRWADKNKTPITTIKFAIVYDKTYIFHSVGMWLPVYSFKVFHK